MNSQGSQGVRAEDPQVTIIIAAYNASAFLQKAVDSVLAHTGVSLEILIVDDASADDTRAVMTALAAADNRIVPIYNQTNTGPAGARNLALQQARGAWIAVLDSDDMFRPARLEEMIGVALSTGADIVIDDFASVDEHGTLLAQNGLAQIRTSGALGLKDWIALNSFVIGELSFGYAKPLISSDFLRSSGVRYNERLRNGEDYHLILEALASGARMQFTAKTGYLYTRRTGSVSQRARLDHLRALLQADQEFADRLDPSEGLDPLLQGRQKNLTSLLITEETFDLLKSGQRIGALAHLIRHPMGIGRFLRHLGEALRKRLLKS